jgi:hypothetical protein
MSGEETFFPCPLGKQSLKTDLPQLNQNKCVAEMTQAKMMPRKLVLWCDDQQEVKIYKSKFTKDLPEDQKDVIWDKFLDDYEMDNVRQGKNYILFSLDDEYEDGDCRLEDNLRTAEDFEYEENYTLKYPTIKVAVFRQDIIKNQTYEKDHFEHLVPTEKLDALWEKIIQSFEGELNEDNDYIVSLSVWEEYDEIDIDNLIDVDELVKELSA